MLRRASLNLSHWLRRWVHDLFACRRLHASTNITFVITTYIYICRLDMPHTISDRNITTHLALTICWHCHRNFEDRRYPQSAGFATSPSQTTWRAPLARARHAEMLRARGNDEGPKRRRRPRQWSRSRRRRGGGRTCGVSARQLAQPRGRTIGGADDTQVRDAAAFSPDPPDWQTTPMTSARAGATGDRRAEHQSRRQSDGRRPPAAQCCETDATRTLGGGAALHARRALGRCMPSHQRRSGGRL